MPVPTTLKIESSTMPAWRHHRRKWEPCTACSLHKCATHKVLARGHLPCEVLFIGEAPGEDEDALGRPFIGRAGKVLDSLITASFSRFREYTYAITNVVACKPFKSGSDICPPLPEAIEACRPRLRTFLSNIACPDVVVLLGKVAEKHAEPVLNTFDTNAWHPLVHPSYIARKGGASSLEFKRALLSLVRFLKATL